MPLAGKRQEAKEQLGGLVMACSHIKNCELFVQFALNPALDIWKENYCQGDFNACARFNISKTGRQIPLTLLPNGKIIQETGDEALCGTTAIFNAIIKNRSRMVRSLIKVGVDINIKNIDGMTPLMAAAECSNVEIAEILIQHGADIHAENMYGHTALEIAEKKGSRGLIELLHRHGGTGVLKTGT